MSAARLPGIDAKDPESAVVFSGSDRQRIDSAQFCADLPSGCRIFDPDKATFLNPSLTPDAHPWVGYGDLRPAPLGSVARGDIKIPVDDRAPDGQ